MAEVRARHGDATAGVRGCDASRGVTQDGFLRSRGADWARFRRSRAGPGCGTMIANSPLVPRAARKLRALITGASLLATLHLAPDVGAEATWVSDNCLFATDGDCSYWLYDGCEAGQPGVFASICDLDLAKTCAASCAQSADGSCVGNRAAYCSQSSCGATPEAWSCGADCVAQCQPLCDWDWVHEGGWDASVDCRTKTSMNCRAQCESACASFVAGDVCDHACSLSATGSCAADARGQCVAGCQVQGSPSCRAGYQAQCASLCSGQGALLCAGLYDKLQVVAFAPDTEAAKLWAAEHWELDDRVGATCPNGACGRSQGSLQLCYDAETGEAKECDPAQPPQSYACSVRPSPRLEGGPYAVGLLLGLLGLAFRRRRAT